MIICNCNNVSYNEIKKFLTKYPHATFSQLKAGTGASTSCGRCTVAAQKTMKRIQAEIPKPDQLKLPF
jgi:bacterioferritin-associated ferredoxin